ncbi:MAG: hypothetical protein Q7U20_02390 [Caulobacter sp.]|nr:hypothetical protein [Caulobacter sp.]
MRLALAIALLLTLGTPPALAQTDPVTPPPVDSDNEPASSDPIGDVIAALPPDQTTDAEADADQGPPPIPTAPPPSVQTPPPTPYRPLVIAPSRGPMLDRPVMIDETGKSPDGPPTPLDLGYESRIRASVAAAQGLQGPLDGGWTVRSTYGVAVLSLQLVDRGNGYGQLEGAWRSLDGPVSKVGLIDSLDRQPVTLTIRITKAPGKPTVVLSLTPAADGGWSGDIQDEWGVHPVTMRRN